MSGFESRDSDTRIYYRKISIQKEKNKDFNPNKFLEIFTSYQGNILDDETIDKFQVRIDILIQQAEVSIEEINLTCSSDNVTTSCLLQYLLCNNLDKKASENKLVNPNNV